MEDSSLNEEADTETVSADAGSFAEWGSIIAEVQDCLPTIDSDSEVSTMTEDSDVEVSVFRREVTTFDANDSDEDRNFPNSLPVRKNWKDSSDKQETVTLASEGYGSATSSSPTSVTSSATSKSTSNEDKILTGSGKNEVSTESTSLLFQRLHNHLESNAVQNDKNDMDLVDLDLDLPIYEDEEMRFFESSSGKTKDDFSPPPMDMRYDSSLPTTTTGSETSAVTELSRSDSSSSGLESASSEGKAPLLSLKGLEDFDLDGLIDDFVDDEGNRFSVPMSSPQDLINIAEPNEGSGTDLMDQLIGLSRNQRGKDQISSLRDRKNIVQGLEDSNQHFLDQGILVKDPGGLKINEEIMEKADIEEINEKKLISDKVSKPATSSCGVSTCFSSNPIAELSWSEPTTIFLDLRQKSDEEEAIERTVVKMKEHKKENKKVSRPRVKRFPQQEASEDELASMRNEVMRRVRSLNKIKAMTRSQPEESVSENDDDGNDDDYDDWQAMRNRIKERSSLTAAASPKNSRSSAGQKSGIGSTFEIDDDLKLDLGFSAAEEPNLGDVKVKVQPAKIEKGDEKVKSFGENIPGIEHIDESDGRSQERFVNGRASQAEIEKSISKKDMVNGIEPGYVDDDLSGMYAKERLKNMIPDPSSTASHQNHSEVKSSLRKDHNRRADRGKITVSFAEEPKKDTSDTTNVYRAKNLTSLSIPNEEVVDKTETHQKKATSTTCSVQTDEQFSTNKKPEVNLHEAVNKLLGSCSEDTTKYKHTIVTDEMLHRQEKLAKQQYENAMFFATSTKIHQDNYYVSRETKLKLKNLLQREEAKVPNGIKVLYDMDASFEQPIPNIPPELNTHHTQMVLLTVNMSSTGSIVTHRSSGGHKGTPVDSNIGFSITFPMLLSWLLALVPEDLTKLQQARMDDIFALEIDPELVPELTNGKDSPSIPLSVDVPFNVVSLHQSWQEDSQSLSLQAIVIPNFYYRPETKRGRKKAKKEDAFLQVVWHFLQSNRIQDVCPWHERPESPIHYSLSETIITCATKPLSTYVAASNDPLLIKKALKLKPGLFWKEVNPDDQNPTVGSSSESNQLKTTNCLLQREAFMYPIAVMDIAIRLQTSCFDLAGLRLAYVSRKFLCENTLYNSTSSKLDQEEIVPCVVMAIRGREAITRWSKIVGPRDPILARMSERMSLNSTYGEQLSIKRGDESLPTDVNMFCYPRSENRAIQQLCVWFGGRVDMESPAISSLLGNDRPANPDDLCKIITNGKANVKNGKNKSRNNSTSVTEHEKASYGIQDLMTSPSYLVTCSLNRLFLVVSPRLPTQFISDVLHTVTQQGFLVQGVRRFRLTEKKASALSISSRYFPCFCPRVNADMPVDVDYYEDIWWIRPATVFLLSRENANAHQAGLVHALQTELMVNLSPPDEEGHVKVITYQCFHTTPYTEAVEHAVGSLTKVPDVELSSGTSPRTFYSNPEMEQVLVLSLLGDRAIDECGDVLRRLLHGEFQYSPEDYQSTGRFLPQSIMDDETDVECFRGFELLGLKWLPSLTSLQAKELTPFEVGTPYWHDSIPLLQASPVILCVLRRVNAFEVLEDVLRIPRYSYSISKGNLKRDEFTRIMSSTPEIAYRQMKIFFSDKELFPDNQSRPLLKYLPPPTRVHQYRQQQPALAEGTEVPAGGDQQNGTSNGGPRTNENSKRSSAKKKKKQNGKNKDTNNNNSNHGNGNHSNKSAFIIPEESIFSSMVSCQQPLTSVIIIKPDAFPRHFIKIFRQLHFEGFSVAAVKLVKMSEDEALQIMPSFLKDMQGEIQVYLDHMTSAPSLVACVQRDNAVRHLCQLAGPHDPIVARRRCYEVSTGSTRPTWRALFGIDNISNGIHVSDSYLSACQEMKRFFPEGICCQETLELRMEMVPTPAEDTYMCEDKMKGREVKVLADFRQAPSTYTLKVTYMPRKPVIVVLTPPLFQAQNSSRSRLSRHPLTQRPMSSGHGTVPPYVEILDKLLSQGFEICASRMVWFRQNQAEQLLQILRGQQGTGNEDSNMLGILTQGSSLLLLMQRENALVLFDSILGSTKSTGDTLFNKYSSNILRTQNVDKTKELAQYLFPRIPCPNSVLQITHKRALEWKDAHPETAKTETNP